MNATPHNMSERTSAELWGLASRYCNDMLDAADVARLETLLAEDAGARSFFGVYASMHAELTWRFRGGAIGETAGGDAAEPAVGPAVVIYPHRAASESSFVGDLAFSYMVASVFMCFLLLGFWAYKLPSDRGSSIASNENSRGLTGPGESSPDRPAPVFVGRVTGIAGAKWSDEPNYIAPIGVRVALGRQYKLKSGLLEITYDSGARVILEGPCSYEVDSTAGGYLALGKLVAKVGAGDKGRGTGEVASGQWSVASVKNEGGRMKDESGRPHTDSLATRHSPLATYASPLSPPPSPLFAVRTPTAVVTDLGTEFGVDVDASGDTTSHVFQGTVVVQAGIRGLGDLGIGNSGVGDSDKRPTTAVVGGEVKSDQSVTLVAGQSVRVGRVCETHQEPATGAVVRFTQPTELPQFARRLREPPKFIDLLDIVAGGDGRGNRRERGIDPVRGFRHQAFTPGVRSSDEQYAPVHWHRFIDGVFVPDGAVGPMQLDSAGHVFDGFPVTSGTTFGSIWARAVEPKTWNLENDPMIGDWVYAIGRSERFMPDGRGLLALCPNVGITVDLAEIRRVYRGIAPREFRAVAGMGDASVLAPATDGMADLWVFVDGRLEWNRMQLRSKDGAVAINVEVDANDRFLTLAVTDGGNGIQTDWVVFGDPELRMEQTIMANNNEELPMER